MFLIRRPSKLEIAEFLARAQDLPLSYGSIGIARQNPAGFKVDETSAVIGRGELSFERARTALSNWRQFDLGWVELFPRGASITPETVVAVLVRHLGFWSLNGCRVVYSIGDKNSSHFGFAYGTLTNHAECGEELFEVSFDPESEAVTYRIRAVSKPHLALVWMGYPFTRALQARFRRHSITAMKNAIEHV